MKVGFIVAFWGIFTYALSVVCDQPSSRPSFVFFVLLLEGNRRYVHLSTGIHPMMNSCNVSVALRESGGVGRYFLWNMLIWRFLWIWWWLICIPVADPGRWKRVYLLFAFHNYYLVLKILISIPYTRASFGKKKRKKVSEFIYFYSWHVGNPVRHPNGPTST